MDRSMENPGETERCFELAPRAPNEALYEWDLSTGAAWLSKAHQGLFGYAAEQVGYRSWQEKIHPEDRGGITTSLQAVLEGSGESWTGEYRVRRADESYAHVVDRAWVVRAPNGRPARVIGAVMDLALQAQAGEALRVRARQLEAIRTVTEEITRELDLSSTLDLIHRRALELVGAEAGTIYLWDEAAELLTPAIWHGHGGWLGEARLKLGEGVAGVVAERREGLIVNDYRHSPHAHPFILEHSQVTAVLGEPLLYHERLLGVITLAYEDPRRVFTAQDRQLLALFATPAAIAIANARLYTATAQRLREMSALYDMSRATTSTLDLDAQLEALLQRLIQAGAHRAMVSLLEAGGGGRHHLRLAYDASRADPWLRNLDLSPDAYPEIQEVVRTRQPLRIPDVHSAPLLHAFRDRLEAIGLRSLAILPLLVRDEAIGAISLGYVGQSRMISEADLRFYQSLADLAATAIANARLFAQVARAKADWENTFNSLSELVAVIDTDRRLRRVNQALADRLGMAPEALVGQHCYTALHGTDSPWPPCPHAETLATGGPATKEVEDPHLGGIFHVTTSPLHDAEGRALGAVHIARDITEMRRLEGEARQRQRFEDLSRAKSAFIASMSHELRSPLNAILGFADLLLQQGADSLSEKQARHLGHIRKAGQHLLQLISDILDLAKVEAGKIELRLEALPVSATLEDILAIARGQANKKAQSLRMEIAPDLPLLWADPVRFKQICFNLLSNAVKFTPEHGTVTLTAGRAPTNPALLEIRVTDTGAGIRAGDLPRLFTEFTQLDTTHDQHREGTGLGLALTKQLVELHGGRIWAESEGEGRGSAFTFILPLAGPTIDLAKSQESGSV